MPINDLSSANSSSSSSSNPLSLPEKPLAPVSLFNPSQTASLLLSKLKTNPISTQPPLQQSPSPLSPHEDPRHLDSSLKHPFTSHGSQMPSHDLSQQCPLYSYPVPPVKQDFNDCPTSLFHRRSSDHAAITRPHCVSNACEINTIKENSVIIENKYITENNYISESNAISQANNRNKHGTTAQDTEPTRKIFRAALGSESTSSNPESDILGSSPGPDCPSKLTAKDIGGVMNSKSVMGIGLRSFPTTTSLASELNARQLLYPISPSINNSTTPLLSSVHHSSNSWIPSPHSSMSSSPSSSTFLSTPPPPSLPPPPLPYPSLMIGQIPISLPSYCEQNPSTSILNLCGTSAPSPHMSPSLPVTTLTSPMSSTSSPASASSLNYLMNSQSGFHNTLASPSSNINSNNCAPLQFGLASCPSHSTQITSVYPSTIQPSMATLLIPNVGQNVQGMNPSHQEINPIFYDLKLQYLKEQQQQLLLQLQQQQLQVTLPQYQQQQHPQQQQSYVTPQQNVQYLFSTQVPSAPLEESQTIHLQQPFPMDHPSHNLAYRNSIPLSISNSNVGSFGSGFSPYMRGIKTEASLPYIMSTYN